MKKVNMLVVLTLAFWLVAHVSLGTIYISSEIIRIAVFFLPLAVSLVSASSAVVFHYNKPMFFAGKLIIGWMAIIMILLVLTLLHR